MIPEAAVEAAPLIFRQTPHYIITTGAGPELNVRTDDPARLIDIITGKVIK